MNAAQVLVLVGSVVTVLGSFLAARVAGRSTVRAAKVSADEGAFTRAKDIYAASIQELEDRVTRIDTDLKAARAEVRTLRRSVSQYEGRVIQLQEVLRMHQIEVPAWTLLPSDAGLLPGSIPDPNQPPVTDPGVG